MKRCPKCRFQLDPVDLKANACPVCGEKLDERRKEESCDPRRQMREDKRGNRPQ